MNLVNKDDYRRSGPEVQTS